MANLITIEAQGFVLLVLAKEYLTLKPYKLECHCHFLRAARSQTWRLQAFSRASQLTRPRALPINCVYVHFRNNGLWHIRNLRIQYPLIKLFILCSPTILRGLTSRAYQVTIVDKSTRQTSGVRENRMLSQLSITNS